MRHLLWVLVLGIVSPLLFAAGDSSYHLSKPRLLPDTITLIQDNYVDPGRAKPLALLRGALNKVQESVPEILANCGESDCTVTVGMASKRFPISGMKSLGDMGNVLQQIFAFIELHYHGKSKANEIEYAAIDGMLDILDPHSNLLTPKIYNEFKIGTKGNFGGLGIVIGTREGQLTVIAPLEGTPAFRAGIKAKDHIKQIGDDSTINMTLTEAVERLRGPVGTPVTITIERAGKNSSFTVTLRRAVIKIESVKSELLKYGNSNYAYVKIKSFQENTDRDMIQALDAMQKKIGRPLDGLILDMRNNPGGLLNQAIAIADYFLKSGAIVSTVGLDNREMQRDMAHNSGVEPTYPIVALINEGSASASEIVAGSLQANNRAEIIGTQSFGKGSVQQVFNLLDDSALKLTVAEYLNAAKYSIQSIGITPDITLIPMTVDKKSMDLIENEYAGEKDLERVLDRPIPSHQTSTLKVHYLNPAAPEDPDDDAISSRDYSDTLNLSDDFAVGLAEKILSQMNGYDTSGVSAKIGPILSQVESEETSKLAKAMEQSGLDWSTGPATGKPKIQIRSELSYKGKRVSSLRAGEEGELTIYAHNNGNGTAYRLIASTKLDEPLFPNKEFIFGKLLPNSTRSWTIPIKLPKQAPSLTLPVKLYFSDANNSGLHPARILVSITEQPRPQFTFRFTLDTPTDSRSKDTERLPRGKDISLSVSVKNVGLGISQDTFVSIRNVEETSKPAFLKLGRVKLGKLAVGKTATATLKFRLDPAFNASTIKFDLSIADANTLEGITQPLILTVGSGSIEPPAGPWYQAPQIALISPSLPIITTAATQSIQAVASDERSVKDCIIYSGDQKVVYAPNPTLTPKFDCSANLPLKPGTNLITLSARDETDLVGRTTFTILRNVDKIKNWPSWLE